MLTEIWVNIGSDNGLLPDGTKPLPESMLTDHQWTTVTFIWGQFHKRCLNHQSLKSVWKVHVWNFIQISQEPMSKGVAVDELICDSRHCLLCKIVYILFIMNIILINLMCAQFRKSKCLVVRNSAHILNKYSQNCCKNSANLVFRRANFSFCYFLYVHFYLCLNRNISYLIGLSLCSLTFM